MQTDYTLPEEFISLKKGPIHKSSNSHVYVGNFNSKKCVLKIFPTKFPSEETIRSYQKDYQINALLHENYPQVFSEPIHFKNEENSLYSVKSALGISIQEYQHKMKEFKVEDFLKLAIKLCQALHCVHEQNVLHCDIKPQNMLYDKEKDICSIIDFESSFLVSLKNPSIEKNERGTYNYMSPEQTGRTSKSIDKTSDIYSLGISFFQMITGELPFKGEVNEVIYGHIAKQPPSLSNFRKDIPISIEKVIQKMIKKNQNERYCSVIGIKKELEFILKNLKNEKELMNFKVGQFDVNDIFTFKNKIYGRDKEIEICKQKVKMIQNDESTEMIMISGVSGIGKSCLVHEVLSSKQDSMILQGKFDQFLQSPFSAFIQIIRKYFQILSSESKEKLEIQKQRISRSLDKNGKILTNLVKESEYILGEQDEMIELPNENEEQKRFIKTLIDFFSIIAINSLLCLFIDDLQWADIPSLKLIESLIKQKNCQILIIGAYRDNEVSLTHPMVTILEPIIQERNFETINLKILELEFVEQMLSDSLNSNDVKELSKLIYTKTNGNPFFIREFVFNLYDKKLIKFNYENESWNWKLDEISKTEFSENVVEFMIQKIHEFPESIKKILNLASCIGCEFTLDLLSILHEKTEEEVYKVLLTPITKGWIFEIGNQFKFVHDRLQQASYEIYEDKEKIHFQIGSLFLETATKKKKISEHIFDIANHLNSAGDYFKDRNLLIELNLQASSAALESHAFETALHYSKIAKSMLPDDSWNVNHEITHKVISAYASNLSFNNHTEEALTNFEELMDHGKTNYELLSTALPFLKLLILKFDFKRCKEIIFLILDLYDGSKNISTLDKPMLIKWIQEMFKEVDESLKDVNTAEEFLALIPEKSNDEFTLLCQFLLISNSPFYQNCYFEMMIVVWLLAVKFTIKEGFNEATPAVLCGAAWMYHAVFESAAPRKLGFLGKELMYTVKNPNIQLFYNLHLSLSLIFTGSMEEGIRVGDNGYTYGLSMGEYTFATFCLMVSADAKIMNGTNYNRLHRQLESSKQIIYSTGYYFGGDMLALKTEFTATLVGKSTSFSPQLAIPGFEKYPMVRELYTVAKIECLYLLRDFDSAREEIEKLQSYRFETLGSCPCYDVALFSVLVYFSQSLPKNYLKEIQSNVDYLKKHNEINPLFFAPRYYLALAVQQSLINDDTMKVFASFQKAIKESECSEFLSALSYEYFSEFCKKKSEFEEYSKFLESKAYIKYKRMGAVCKFKHLNPTDFSISEYSSNSDSPSGSTTSTGSNTTMNSGGGGGAIDLQTILKSSSTISEGLDKERLLKKLNEVIVQNAGAERGYIILNENNKYIVKSAFSKDKCHKGKIISENTDIISLKVFNQCLNQKEILILKNAKNEMSDDLYVQKNKVKSILCAPILKGKHLFGILYLENNSMEGTFNLSRKFIFQHILSQVAIAIENITLFEDVKTINTAYARFLPSEFLNQLSKKDVRNIQPSDSVEKKMTILFSDIRNFTSITDKMNSKESFEFVNEILSKLAPSISSNHGFVDKFIGDCVMAIFPKSPLDAVKSGIQMLNSLKELNKNKEIPINIGVGIAFGNVMLGTLGFEKRLDATVISNTVNTASRMESLTKIFGVNMIITQEVYEEIKQNSEVNCHLLGSFYLKGQKNAKKLFEVSLKSDKLTFDENKFQIGIELFSNKKFKEAIQIFNELKNERKICSYYLNVCELYQLIELPLNWKGEIKISKDGDAQPFGTSNQEITDVKNQLVLIQKLMGNQDKFRYLFEAAKKIDNNIDE